MKLKNYVLGMGLALTCAGSLASASDLSIDEDTKNYTIGLNPLGLIFGSYSADVGYKIDDQVTLGIEGAYADSTVFGVSTKGAGAGIYGSYHANGVSESGFYTRGGLRYQTSEMSMKKENYEFRTVDGVKLDELKDRSVNLSVIGGYQKFLNENLSVDAGLGIQAVLYGKGDIADGATFVDLGNNRKASMGKKFNIDGRLGLNFHI